MAELVEEQADDFAILNQEEALIAGALQRVAQAHLAPTQVVATIDSLADYFYVGGHWRLGMELFTLQLVIRHEVGDRAGEGATLHNLGALASSLSHLEEAEHYYEQALAIRREVGDRAGEGITLHNLGSLAHDLGHTEEAARYYEQALAIFDAIGAIDSARGVRDNLAAMAQGHVATGDPSSGQEISDHPVTLAEVVDEGDDAGQVAAPSPEAVTSTRRRWWPWQGK